MFWNSARLSWSSASDAFATVSANSLSFSAAAADLSTIVWCASATSSGGEMSSRLDDASSSRSAASFRPSLMASTSCGSENACWSSFGGCAEVRLERLHLLLVVLLRQRLAPPPPPPPPQPASTTTPSRQASRIAAFLTCPSRPEVVPGRGAYDAGARAASRVARTTLRPWPRRRCSRASSCRSSRGCLASAPSTRWRSRSAPRRSPPLDQARVEALRSRARHPDDGPHDARGPGHAREGRRDLLEGGAAGSGRRDGAVGGRGLRVPEPRALRRRAARGHGRQGRVGGDRVSVGPVADRCEGSRDGGSRGDGRRRGGHGHRPRRIPVGPVREGLRRDRPREGGLRGRPPQGDPRGGRAGHLRQRPARLDPRRSPPAPTSSRRRPGSCPRRRRCP